MKKLIIIILLIYFLEINIFLIDTRKCRLLKNYIFEKNSLHSLNKYCLNLEQNFIPGSVPLESDLLTYQERAKYI